MSNTVIEKASSPVPLKAWILAARPKTLTAGLVPIVVATALVKAEGWPVSWWISSLALLSSIFIQIGTNLVNDAIDFKKGADTETRTGPQRVTQGGFFSAKTVLRAGFFCFFLAASCGLPLVMAGGWPILIVGLLSLFLGYAYTGGPFPLAYLGLGDLFVIAFFGVVAVGGVYYLQTHMLAPSAMVAGLQVGFLATVLIAINNLRDEPQDRLVAKRTLAVRFGVTFARIEILLLTVAPFATGMYWFNVGHRKAAILPLVSFPIVRRLLYGVLTEAPGPVYNKFLAQAALVHLLFGLVFSFALLWP